MPLKLSTGITKTTGLSDDGSFGAVCHIELEIADSLLQLPEALQPQVALAFDVCRQAVETELSCLPRGAEPTHLETRLD